MKIKNVIKETILSIIILIVFSVFTLSCDKKTNNSDNSQMQFNSGNGNKTISENQTTDNNQSVSQQDIRDRKSDIIKSIKGYWGFEFEPRDIGIAEKVYRHSFNIYDKHVTFNTTYYIHEPPYSDSQDLDLIYANCELKDFTLTDVSDNDEYILETDKCGVSFKVVYSNGSFSEIYFLKNGDYGWHRLTRKTLNN